MKTKQYYIKDEIILNLIYQKLVVETYNFIYCTIYNSVIKTYSLYIMHYFAEIELFLYFLFILNIMSTK